MSVRDMQLYCVWRPVVRNRRLCGEASLCSCGTLLGWALLCVLPACITRIPINDVSFRVWGSPGFVISSGSHIL